MALAISRNLIEKWCGASILAMADSDVKRGAVLKADISGDSAEGLFARNDGSVLKCRFHITPKGYVETECPCVDGRRGIVCRHVAALALHILARQNNPERQRLYLEEQRRARKMEAGFSNSVNRSPSGRPASLLIELERDWTRQFDKGSVTIRCAFQISGSDAIVPPEALDKSVPLSFTPEVETMLDILEDSDEKGISSAMSLGRYDFLNLLDVCRGQILYLAGGGQLPVNREKSSFSVMIDLDRETGELLLFPKAGCETEDSASLPLFFAELERSCALYDDTVWILKPALPLPYHSLYRDTIAIPREGILAFFQSEFPRLQKAGIPFTFEPGTEPHCFTTAPGNPDFLLEISGREDVVSARLFALYGDGAKVPACAPESLYNLSIPDPDDLRRFYTRNMASEGKALARLTTRGFLPGNSIQGDSLQSVTGRDKVLTVLGSLLPPLRRLGWKIDITGKIADIFDNADMVVPVVKIEEDRAGGRYFNVGIECESNGRRIPDAVVQTAINKGEGYLSFDGRTVLLDIDAVTSMRSVFSDCGGDSSGMKYGFSRMSSVYAPYVFSAINALDGIDIDLPKKWRERAEKCNRSARMTPVPLGELDGVLRPYQKEGVYWMRFLEASGFCGILADEMGLGKTLQTLTWLSLERTDRATAKAPALIVAPTSLVENWNRECAKFTPWRKCAVMSGASRHQLWDSLGEYDIVITSYALLRRDLERYSSIQFSAAVLDEAQHIKNRSTQNAIAAQQINAKAKLVLTGTPVENGVSDLWSIMNFLMPGYLGAYREFKDRYEIPIAAGDQAGEDAQLRLKRKLRPFLMRRMKKDVAKDLPDKIQKVSFSALSPEQERTYAALLAVFQKKIGDMVAKKGFDKCRMDVLAVLLRLRQICCHLALIPAEMRGGTGEDAPSGKLDQFFDILDEAIDGGHRVLVFSQFVGMLTILKNELVRREIKFCYIDGQTKDRVDQCRRFNQDESIPVFLISLKAGGTGLNLTGADMVVHFDPWWNPAVEDQATDRAHRIGQKRTVCSVKLIAQNTVEEKVLALQKRKQAVIQATVSTSDSAIMESLSWDDVKSLLDING